MHAVHRMPAYLCRGFGEGVNDGAAVLAVDDKGIRTAPQLVTHDVLYVFQLHVNAHHTQVTAIRRLY